MRTMWALQNMAGPLLRRSGWSVRGAAIRECQGHAKSRAWLVCLACCLVLALAACKTTSKQQETRGLTPPPPTTDAERLGDQYMANNMAQAAIPQFEQALATGADKSSVAWRIGNAYFSLKKWPEALEAFRQAIAADPRMAIAYEGAGYASFELGRFDEATVFFEQAAELAPNHWVPHAFLAVLYRLEDQREQSEQAKNATLTLAGEANKLMAADTIRRALNRALALRGKTTMPPPADPVQDLALLEAPGGMGAQRQAPPAADTPDAILDPLSRDMDILGLDDGLGNARRPGVRTESSPPQRPSPEAIEAQGAQKAVPKAEQAKVETKTEPKTESKTEPTPVAAMPAPQAAVDNGTAAVPAKATAAQHVTVAPPVPAAANPVSDNASAAKPPAAGNATGEPYLVSTPVLSPGAAKQGQAKQEAASAPPPAAPGNATGTAAAKNPAPPASSKAPAAAKTPAGDETPARPAPGEPYIYSLLESSWKSKDRALERANYLRLRGVRAQIMEADLGAKGLHYRVMIGSRQRQGDIEDIKKELQKRYGLSGLVILRIRPGSLQD